MWMTRIALILLASVLSACASGPRMVDAEVRTSAAQAPGNAVLQAARYRFERAPLVAGQPAPEKLEAMAQAALARVGAQRDDARARLSVQVGGYVNAYWRDEWGGMSNARIALGMTGSAVTSGITTPGATAEAAAPSFMPTCATAPRSFGTP